MGAGILPTTMHKGTLYFLFGKENKFADTPGWSDFGGGTDKKESFIQTAVREGGEELTGFLGSDVKSMLQAGTYTIDNDTYRMHIVYMPFNPYLPLYYNNNQQFLQNHLDASVIRKTKIFEKAEIRWVSVHDIHKMLPQFRSYFQTIVRKIEEQKGEISRFIRKQMAKKNQNKKKNTTRRRKTQQRQRERRTRRTFS